MCLVWEVDITPETLAVKKGKQGGWGVGLLPVSVFQTRNISQLAGGWVQAGGAEGVMGAPYASTTVWL